MKHLNLLKSTLLLFALVVGSTCAWAETLTIDFESAPSSYTDWTFTNFTSKQTNGNVVAHGGSYLGTTGGKETGSVVTKQKIASPTSITFYISKASTNTSASSWLVKVSSDGETWTTVGDPQSAGADITRGTWYEVTRNLSTYKNVYVGVFYDGTTAVRTIDDLTLTYIDPSLSYWVATYDYNDGETANKVVNVDKTTQAATYTLEAAPSRANFNFLGWNDGTKNYNGGASYPMTSDKTFTAQWEYSGPHTSYNKSSKSDLATGAQYILVGDKSGTNHFANNDIASGHLYFSSSAVSNANSSITSTKAIIVDEEPLVLTLEETADGWYLKNADGDKLGMSGDKKMSWNSGDITWVLGGTDDIPTFSASYDESNYTLYYNSGATRFNGYTSKGSNVNAYYYRLDDGKDVYTLTLDFNDGETADGTHRVLEGASYTLTAPTRAGYAFVGWNTEEDGTGTTYGAGAYTMPAAATRLYAQWSNTIPATFAAGKTMISFSDANAALDLSALPAGLKAYKVSSANASSVTLTEVTEVVAKNTGLILTGSESTTYDIPVVASGTDISGTNLLVASDGTSNVENAYVLSAGKFHPVQDGGLVIPAGKAYLPDGSISAHELDITFDNGDVTGIKAVNTQKSFDGSFYNLNGQRIAQPTKGLYIVNGKKVVLK